GCPRFRSLVPWPLLGLLCVGRRFGRRAGIRWLSFRWPSRSLLRLARFGGLGGLLNCDGGGSDAKFPLADDGVDSRDVTLDCPQPAVALKLACCGLEAKVKEFFLRFLEFLDQAVVFESVELGRSE